MKKLFNIFLVALGIITAIGCNDTEDLGTEFNVIAANTNFQAPGGNGYIQLQTTGNIAVDISTDWCVLKGVNSSKVEFEVKENVGYSGRNALLTISNGLEHKTFTINQSGAVFVYGKDEWMLRTSNKAASLPIKLYGSFDCEVNIPQEARSWLSYQPDTDGKGGKFIVEENTLGKIRGTNVEVISGDRTASYQVIQYDLDEFIGIWQGQFTDMQSNYALPDVQIEKTRDGAYTLSNILTRLPYKLKAKTADNCFIFEAGQNLGQFNDDLYLSFQLIDSNFYYVKDPSSTISLGPVLLSDGSFILAFAGIKETDPYGFVFRLYDDEALEAFNSNLLIFVNCFLYK